LEKSVRRILDAYHEVVGPRGQPESRSQAASTGPKPTAGVA
jgi:hypothetical protein